MVICYGSPRQPPWKFIVIGLDLHYELVMTRTFFKFNMLDILTFD